MKKFNVLFLISLFLVSISWCNIKLSSKNYVNSYTTGALSERVFNSWKEFKVISSGNKVWVDYILKLSNWKIVDTSIEKVAKQYGIYNPTRAYTPLEFIVWAWQVIRGFEKAVIWHKVGDKITVKVPPEEGYWECDPKLIKWINKSIFDNAGIKPEVGKVYNLWSLAKVIAVSWDKVKVDFNSPLCGKTLIFDIFIKKVE